MRPITREDAQKIKVRPNGRMNYVRGILMNMKPGELIFLEKADWTQKYRKPNTYCLQLGRKTGCKWTVLMALDGSGWVIERLK